MNAELAIAKPFTTSSGKLSDLHNRGELVGKIVLMGRDAVSLQTKARAAQDAGAVGVIVVNNDQAKPDAAVEMIVDDSSEIVDIPVLIISSNSGDRALALGPGTTVVFTGPSYSPRSVLNQNE